MQFVYCEQAGEATLNIDNELFKYLFKVRRHQLQDIIEVRNLKDDTFYSYEVQNITKKEATLLLQKSEEKPVNANMKLRLGWCVVDTKTIEKQLPYLNELGVYSIAFIYADYSQKNFKLNLDKYEKILINSSQQCGRSSLMQFEVFKSLDEYLKSYPEAYMFNFSQQHVQEVSNIDTIVVGCEGGFSKREIALFNEKKIVGIDSNLVLRSETAVTTLAAKLIV
ncbi:16S rRNA (uracil(1498)-N(3))-methyltransferase [Candidatus Marinarcus aquaticus]|uniref:Ribosomal RNA small subunit methyltransferase E n=1 Tax=Candidatus Marinarcus aquaticus TaxID=2044504 RepID=A0A4Q0XPN2_9BACT|nr:16S rRNA (uracil(1498)-N(3))-methyltransferase [Candidatus Marinarcus aquaticus]RXJ57689.1 16S rRNA (uracil(1498)-N(3))-methyltransferase [Candidatus Marinarcus aquaticus]